MNKSMWQDDLDEIARRVGVTYDGPDDDGVGLFVAIGETAMLVQDMLGEEFCQRPLAELLPEVARSFTWPVLRLQRAAETAWGEATRLLNVYARPSRLRAEHKASGVIYEIERQGEHMTIVLEVGDVWGRFTFDPDYPDRCLYESGNKDQSATSKADFFKNETHYFPGLSAEHIETIPAHEWVLFY